VYLELQKRLAAHLRGVLAAKYNLQLETIPLEIPPDLQFGELATPIAFELARKLRKAPKIIAQEIVAALGPLRGFELLEVAGAGYINARLDRAVGVRMVADGERLATPASGLHSLVEHSSINPNKAAHIGHLRNAILGDTFVRLLRAAGQKVDIQNYIDNTGVQVADVVVGFLHLEKKTAAEVRALIAGCEASAKDAKGKSGAFDYYCWDLYAKTSQWYGAADIIPGGRRLSEVRELIAAARWPEKARIARERRMSIIRNLSKKQRELIYRTTNDLFVEYGDLQARVESRKKLRYATLHEIERGGNETAEVAELISTAVLRRHLETMLRLDIEYDFLPRESEILHLKFWDAAFEQLKQTGVLYFENEGKNKGCWVMTRPGAEVDEGALDEDAKVIVRSNGTVTYVGKDIAYHLWKFGLLGKDFGYKPFFTYPDHECWISTEKGEENHPHFGGAQAIYNVIDSRQSDPQANVIQALRGMGHTDQADRYTHFGYEMVALTPRCAVELGYSVSEEDLSRPYIEVSGRKGFGVKADDLIDKLIAATRAEVDARQTGRDEAERQRIAEQIAIGALRYFMLKFTRNSVIAFDFKDALSFEGETGPYIQYAVVRARNIFRKAETTPGAVLAEFAGLADSSLSSYLQSPEAADIWSLWLRAGRRTLVLEQCIATSEPANLAKHAFQLAQEFNNFYHKHHILSEEDPARKTFLLATAAVALRELVVALSWLGIESPEAM
jgi:arginyl-tRNA synthetase